MHYYTEEEEAWLELFHAKLRVAVENGRVIKLPGAMPITKALNSYVASKDVNSGETVLAPRTVEFVRGKLELIWLQERKRLRSMLGGKSGTVYVPSIAEEELEAYQRERVVTDDAVSEGEGIDVTEEVTDNEGSPGRKRRRLVQHVH